MSMVASTLEMRFTRFGCGICGFRAARRVFNEISRPCSRNHARVAASEEVYVWTCPFRDTEILGFTRRMMGPTVIFFGTGAACMFNLSKENFRLTNKLREQKGDSNRRKKIEVKRFLVWIFLLGNHGTREPGFLELFYSRWILVKNL